MATTATKGPEAHVGETVAQARGITLSDLRQVVPGRGMPPEARIMRSNNNLDVARHDDGRLYFAFRSAPTHFAHPACRFYVMASDDGGENWQLEAKIKRGRDIREPRLLSWNGRLFL
ncbi:MAG: exo-alpha-sialidase, partial [Chloroflexi bacterium]